MTTAEDVRTVSPADGTEEAAVGPEVDVTAHCCSPERTVFTEKDNTDGWIATDTTVKLRR